MVNCGKKLEWVTGGYIKAAYHEIFYGENTEAAKQQAIKEGRSLWRVASNNNSHFYEKYVMTPLEHFCTEESLK